MTYPTNPCDPGRVASTTPSTSPLPVVDHRAARRRPAVAREHRRRDRLRSTNRLYIQPGSMIKFDKGSGLDVLNPAASLNVGSRSYINGFDQNNGYNPSSPGFVAEGATDPDGALHHRSTTTPPPPRSCRRSTSRARRRRRRSRPPCGAASGSITGADVVINDATFQYGGGAINTRQLHDRLAVGPGVHLRRSQRHLPAARRL